MTTEQSIGDYDVREHLISAILEVVPDSIRLLSELKTNSIQQLIQTLVNEFKYKCEMEYERGNSDGFNRGFASGYDEGLTDG